MKIRFVKFGKISNLATLLSALHSMPAKRL